MIIIISISSFPRTQSLGIAGPFCLCLPTSCPGPTRACDSGRSPGLQVWGPCMRRAAGTAGLSVRRSHAQRRLERGVGCSCSNTWNLALGLGGSARGGFFVLRKLLHLMPYFASRVEMRRSTIQGPTRYLGKLPSPSLRCLSTPQATGKCCDWGGGAWTWAGAGPSLPCS